MNYPFTRRLLAVGLGALLLLLIVLPACSNDPILGPNEGEKDDSGGSYSAIERLAPSDTSRAPSSNPDRF
ncbi:hypothetical protein GGQ08_002111 [Salinibacter ruber]|uniref:hypothetical protein n=1 Tax=Salinibacter ruber TaxID=146919 RepID=UPI0021677DEC|nr:hypothetical protein [Salinibacter ruber]MCS3650817.1 hypothetical protein [Salinibacter ruber]MCS3654071.1 hypothetical protein [Salinibacter ruber]